MKKQTTAKLEDFFASLESDLEIGLAVCLATAYGISYPEVFRAYEAWQIKPVP